MKTTLDWKSLLLGIAVASVITTAFSANARTGSVWFSRYEIESSHSHAYVLDTITGQVWEHPLSPEEAEDTDAFFKPKTRHRPH